MPQSLDESVFRVLNADGQTVGTGFVITSGLAVTCAHVVKAAGCRPGRKVRIRFYKDSKDLRVMVLKDPWSPVEQDDLAFLRLDELASLAHPLKLASAAGTAHHLYTSLGFPKGTGEAQARRPSGAINGLVPSQGRCDWLELKGDEMNYGMSGSPILDLALDRVVGMVSYHVDGSFARTVYATTSDTLQTYFPDLVFPEPDVLADYRARLMEETRYVNFSGIPLPTARDGRPVEINLPLEKVYIRLRTIADQQQQKLERKEQHALVEQSSFSLDDVLLLGEYLYHRRPTADVEDLTPVDPQQALEQHGKIVIIGAPGSGKSTLLRWLARQTLTSSTGLIPILVLLREYGPAVQHNPGLGLREFALRRASGGDERLHAVLDEAAHAGNLLWLVDALDEARFTGKQDLHEAASLPGQVLITSRPVGFIPTGLESLPKFEILPLSVENSNDFLERWFEALPNHSYADWTAQRKGWLKSQLDQRPQIARLALSPLLLTFLAVLAASDPLAPLPETRAALYDQFIRRLYHTWEDRQSVEEVRGLVLAGFTLLGWVLHFLYYAGKPQYEPTRAVLVERLTRYRLAGWQLPSKVQVEAVLDFWLKAGMLETWRIGPAEYLAFRHLTFQEYAAAQALSLVWNRSFRDSRLVWHFLSPRLHLPSWREASLMLCGVLPGDQSSHLVERVLSSHGHLDSQLGRNLQLAVQMTGEISELDDAVLDKVKLKASHFFISTKKPWLKIRIIRLAGDTRKLWPLDLLHQALRDEDWGVSSSALDVMRQMGDIEGLRQALKDRSENARGVAAWALGQQGDQEALPALRQALQDKNRDVRRAVVDSFRQLGDYEGLYQALRDENQNVRSAAVEALRHLGNIEGLRQALRDENRDVRSAAVEALRHLGDREGVRQALRDEDMLVRGSAVRALAQFGDREGVRQALRDGSETVRRSAVRALAQFGDREGVQQAIRDEDWDVRIAAMNAMRQMGDHQGVFQGLRDKDWHMRRSAVYMLGQIGDQEVLPPLHQALRDADWHVRRAAVEVLRQLRNSEDLCYALKDEDENVSSAAVEALKKLGDLNALPALRQALRNKSAKVRSAAVDALGKHEDEETLAALRQTLQDENRDVRSAAVDALGQHEDREALPALRQTLQDESANVRRSAVRVLGLLGDQEALPAIRQALRDKDWLVRSVANDVLRQMGDIEGLQQALQDENWHVRSAAVNGLSQLGDREGVRQALQDENWMVRSAAVNGLSQLGDREGVRQALQDENWSVRNAAVNGLSQLGDREGVRQALRHKFMHVRVAAVDALGKLGDREGVFQALRDDNWGVRSAAVRALTQLGDQEALPTLRQVLRDDDWHVRRAAVDALRKLGDRVGLSKARWDENRDVRRAAVEALRQQGDQETLPALRQALRDESMNERSSLMRVIGQFVRFSNYRNDILRELRKAEKKEQWDLVEQATAQLDFLTIQQKSARDLLLPNPPSPLHKIVAWLAALLAAWLSRREGK